MVEKQDVFSTGIPSMDNMLGGLKAGDSIVWRVEHVAEITPVLEAYMDNAAKENKPLVYFRFAGEIRSIVGNRQVIIHDLDPAQGFERFVEHLFDLIKSYQGKQAYFIFDNLSDLLTYWYSDNVIKNFFTLLVPYLNYYGSIAYFFVQKKHHTPVVEKCISQIAQVVIDAFIDEEQCYIQPQKVNGRVSDHMFKLHKLTANGLIPESSSAVVSRLATRLNQPWIDYDIVIKDDWAKTVLRGYEIQKEIEAGKLEQDHDIIRKKLINMMIADDEELLPLCLRYFKTKKLVSIARRMIGSGRIGGKAVGMLLAREILKKKDDKWLTKLETHDSFFIGSDVFYNYLIENDCWWERHQMKKAKNKLEKATTIRKRIIEGRFPREIEDKFVSMLSYFGQSPIIVRSSSLLEDAYGNAFSGKYDSVFCVNQGSIEERLADFVKAVQQVYASTMSKEAIMYLEHKGLQDKDEQMPILVQRVSGNYHGDYYFPHAAGVAYSYNPYVWNEKIDPEAGMARLVFGLGTRAVDRHDDDYTRVIALNAPLNRPESSFDDIMKYTQRRVDVLDLKKDTEKTISFDEVVKEVKKLPLEVYANRDREIERRAHEHGLKDVNSWVLGFEYLLTETSLAQDLQDMIKTIKEAYDYHVDVEFSYNYFSKEDQKINLLQCRPFQFVGDLEHVDIPKDIPDEKVVLRTSGPILGQSRAEKINRIIYIEPAAYSKLSESDRYAIARLVGQLCNSEQRVPKTMLIGPGRWGTRMPSLGVPVNFPEIKNISILCELALMHAELSPDVSLGTHFFNDLVEMNIMYMGVDPKLEASSFDFNIIAKFENKLRVILPDAKRWIDTVFVFDIEGLQLKADTLNQEGILFLS